MSAKYCWSFPRKTSWPSYERAGVQADILSSALQIYYGAGTGTNLPGPAVSSNTWYHVAITRASSSLKLFLNGTQQGSTATDNTNYNQSYLWVGVNAGAGASFYPGYITNLRAVKGVAVYTANFTTPTTNLGATQSANENGNPSAAITGTQTGMLLNATTNATLLTDSSSYAMTITNNGTATWSSTAPF